MERGRCYRYGFFPSPSLWLTFSSTYFPKTLMKTTNEVFAAKFTPTASHQCVSRSLSQAPQHASQHRDTHY